MKYASSPDTDTTSAIRITFRSPDEVLVISDSCSMRNGIKEISMIPAVTLVSLSVLTPDYVHKNSILVHIYSQMNMN